MSALVSDSLVSSMVGDKLVRYKRYNGGGIKEYILDIILLMNADFFREDKPQRLANPT